MANTNQYGGLPLFGNDDSMGSVTSVSVTPGTGVDASVTNPTTTPDITIDLIPEDIDGIIGQHVLAYDPVNNINTDTVILDTSLQNLYNFAINNGQTFEANSIAVTNINISNPGTAVFDGVTLTNGQTLFITNQYQTDDTECGLWIFNGSGVALTRSTLMNTWEEVAGSQVAVPATTTYTNGSLWRASVPGTGTIGVTPITFAQLPGGIYMGGTAISVVGDTISGVIAGTSDIYTSSPTAVKILPPSLASNLVMYVESTNYSSTPWTNGQERIIAGLKNVAGNNAPLFVDNNGLLSLHWEFAGAGFIDANFSVILSNQTTPQAILISYSSNIGSVSTADLFLSNFALGFGYSSAGSGATIIYMQKNIAFGGEAGFSMQVGFSGNGTFFNEASTSIGALTSSYATLSGKTSVTATSINSPTLISPALGTPVSGTLTNCTGLPLTTGITGQLPLANGGTNANLTAANGAVVYSSASALALLAPGTSGQLLQSQGPAAPIWTTVLYPTTATINSIFYASSANVMGQLTTPNSSVLCSSATGVPTWVGSMTDGQVIVGSTSGTPVATTITAGAGISITNGAGSITISSPDSGIAWSSITGTSATLAVNNGYIINNASLVTLTLPVNAAIGDVISIRGIGAGGFTVVYGSGQMIHVSPSTSTTTTGSISSTNRYDAFDLTCVVTNTEFSVTGLQSSGLTIV